MQLVDRVAARWRARGGAGAVPGLVALDVGTEFAKALIVGVEGDPAGAVTGVVRGAGRQRQGLSHMQSGTVTDIDGVIRNCAAALEQAEAGAGMRPAAAVIGIAGELVKGTTSVVIDRRSDPRAQFGEEELESVVKRVQDRALRDAEERISWESGVDRLDVRLVHAAIVEMKIDGYPVHNPIGFTGSQLEIAVFNAFAPMVHLGALQAVANGLGLELMGVIAEPYAVATCLQPGEVGDAGAVFIDVGGGTTDVALVRHGGISGTKMLALGGRAFTKGLAERFGLSFERAEALKLDAAAELASPQPPGARDETLAADAAVWLRGIGLMIGDLAEGELLPGRIYLCGGGAELPHISDALRGAGWWTGLPFARQPEIMALAPEDVSGLRDETGELATRQDVTPLALARQALILDAQSTAVERAMRRAVRAMNL